MLPTLQAEESMREAERIAIGTGAIRGDQRRRILRTWRRDLGGGVRQKAPRIDASTLRQMGIKVVTRG